jgi:hypothetical protein
MDVAVKTNFSNGSGGGGASLLVGQTISGTGLGADILLNGASEVGLTFSAPVGTVYQAHVQLEDDATGNIIGITFWPSTETRWFDIPGGVTTVRFNTTYWSDAGGTDTVVLTIQG